MILTIDRRPETAREHGTFAAGRRAQIQYARRLREVASQIGSIARAHEPGQEREIELMLRDYADLIGPWARSTARRALQDVMRRDERAWVALGRDMERELRDEILTAPTGAVMREALDRQVRLITSLPLDAARRVRELADGALYSGARPDEIAQEIMRSGDVAKSRADLIARTEIARASSELTRARAQHVGSEGYVWRTAEDPLVRPLHRRLAGRFIRWDDPPVAGEHGERAHAGQIYNCRCYPEPVIPGERRKAARAA